MPHNAANSRVNLPSVRPGRPGPASVRSGNASGLDREDRKLFALNLRSILNNFAKQPWAFWLLCFYVVVEYLRMHQAYPVLDILPWGQLALGSCVGAFFLGGRFYRRFSTMDALILGFFSWVVLSCLLAWSPRHAWMNWTTFASWILLYFLVSTIVTTRHRLFLFWLFLFLVNLKMSQHGTRDWIARGFSFASYGVSGSPGWFQNSGEFAMEMTFFLGVSWFLLAVLRPYLKKWKWRTLLILLPGTAVASILASSSRGGQLAAAGVVLGAMILSGVRTKRLFMVFVVILGGWLAMPEAQKARFSAIGQDDTSTLRLVYWGRARAIAREHPITGIGYKNWAPYIASTDGRIYEVVHNTTLEAAVELGYPGAFLFLLLIVWSFRLNWRTRKGAKGTGPWENIFLGMARGLDAGMIGLLIASQFMSVLFYPMFWMSFGLSSALAEGVKKAARVHGRATNSRQLSHPPTPAVRESPGFA